MTAAAAIGESGAGGMTAAAAIGESGAQELTAGPATNQSGQPGREGMAACARGVSDESGITNAASGESGAAGCMAACAIGKSDALRMTDGGCANGQSGLAGESAVGERACWRALGMSENDAGLAGKGRNRAGACGDAAFGSSSSSSSSSSSLALFTAYQSNDRELRFYNRDGETERISSATVAEWRDIFAEKLDIDRELDGIRNWLLTHPEARPHAGREFMEAYIGNCLNAKLQRRGASGARKVRKPWQPFKMPQRPGMRDMLRAMFQKPAAAM